MQRSTARVRQAWAFGGNSSIWRELEWQMQPVAPRCAKLHSARQDLSIHYRAIFSASVRQNWAKRALPRHACVRGYAPAIARAGARSRCVRRKMHMHTHARTWTRTPRTRTRAQARTHARTHARPHGRTCTYIDTQTHKH
eukprot:1664337-Pleurochrysis_carterae.AAC.1